MVGRTIKREIGGKNDDSRAGQAHVPHIWVVISCDFRSRCRGLGTVARSLAAGWVCKPDRFVDSARNDSSRSLHGVAMSNRRDRDVEENTYETDL